MEHEIVVTRGYETTGRHFLHLICSCGEASTVDVDEELEAAKKRHMRKHTAKVPA